MSRSNNGSYNASFGASFQHNTVLRPSKPVLLISEQYFRDSIYISDSINSKLLMTSIRESQDVDLATVIGTDFLFAIQWMIENNQLTALVKELLDYYIRPFLLYQSAAIVAKKMNYHLSNKGDVKSEETVDPKRMVDYYNTTAGSHLRRLRDYLTQNYDKYKDYLGTTNEIYDHINASFDTGVWLGGPSMKWHGKVDPGKFR